MCDMSIVLVLLPSLLVSTCHCCRCLAEAYPGNTLAKLHSLSVDLLSEGLFKLGVLPGQSLEDISRGLYRCGCWLLCVLVCFGGRARQSVVVRQSGDCRGVEGCVRAAKAPWQSSITHKPVDLPAPRLPLLTPSRPCLPPGRDFYCHSVGHYLGLDVHDTNTIGPHRTLEPGVVLAIEPGLYIPNHPQFGPYAGIGVRIEDDVLITQTGCQVGECVWFSAEMYSSGVVLLLTAGMLPSACRTLVSFAAITLHLLSHPAAPVCRVTQHPFFVCIRCCLMLCLWSLMRLRRWSTHHLRRRCGQQHQAAATTAAQRVRKNHRNQQWQCLQPWPERQGRGLLLVGVAGVLERVSHHGVQL